MRVVKLVGVVLVAVLFLVPAVFLRSSPVGASDRPLWTSVQKLTTDRWTGSGVIVATRPSLTTAGACNVVMLTAQHVATEEITVPDAPEMEKMGPAISRRVTQAPGLRWGDNLAIGVVMHPTQDLAVVIFLIKKPCAEMPFAVATINTAPTIAPLAPILHVGFPHGLPMLAPGFYVGPTSEIEGEYLHVTTSVGGPGSSGGAIFYEGKLIGILVRGENRPPFRNLFTPVVYVTDIWQV